MKLYSATPNLSSVRCLEQQDPLQAEYSIMTHEHGFAIGPCSTVLIQFELLRTLAISSVSTCNGSARLSENWAVRRHYGTHRMSTCTQSLKLPLTSIFMCKYIKWQMSSLRAHYPQTKLELLPRAFTFSRTTVRSSLVR